MLKSATAFAVPNPVDRALGWRGCASTVANIIVHYEIEGDELEKSLQVAETALSSDLLGELDTSALADWCKKKGSERSRSEFLLAFRAKLGEKAHHFKNGAKAKEWVSASVDWAWKDQQPKLSGVAYRRLTLLQQHVYDQSKKLRERRADVVRRAQEHFEAGKFNCLTAAASTRTRASGAGPPTQHKEVAEALYNHFIHYYVELRGRVTSALMRAKAITLFTHYQAQPGSEALPESWQGDWLTDWLRRWRELFDLSFRSKNSTYSLSYEECRRRLGMLWRNAIRTAGHFWPNELHWDAFDHTPTTRRLCTGKQLAPTGAEKVGAKEDNVGDHDRHTTVLWSSSDGKLFTPHVCFKAKDPTRLKDINLRKVPKGLCLQFSESGSYGEQATLDMLKEKLPSNQLHVGKTNGWRGLLYDQMDGQLTPPVIKCCLERRRIPNVIWGSLTKMVQPADKRQNQDFKARSAEIECQACIKKLEKRPEGIAKFDREELMYRTVQACASMAADNMHHKMAREFPKSGINLKLDGSNTQELLDNDLKPFWNDLKICGDSDMTSWREQYMKDVAITREAQALKAKGADALAKAKLDKRKMQIPGGIDELIHSFENPHIPLEEILAREDADFVQFSDEEKAVEAGRNNYI